MYQSRWIVYWLGVDPIHSLTHAPNKHLDFFSGSLGWLIAQSTDICCRALAKMWDLCKCSLRPDTSYIRPANVFLGNYGRKTSQLIKPSIKLRNHNSVLGIRDVARDASVAASVILPEEVDDWLDRREFSVFFCCKSLKGTICNQAKRKEKRFRERKACLLFVTSLKINMEPKNGGLEDDFPFQLGNFWVLC